MMSSWATVSEPCRGLCVLLFLHLHTFCKFFCKIKFYLSHMTILPVIIKLWWLKAECWAIDHFGDQEVEHWYWRMAWLYENIKVEAMRRMIQYIKDWHCVTKHQRENMELSVTYFEPVRTLSAIISPSLLLTKWNTVHLENAKWQHSTSVNQNDS